MQNPASWLHMKHLKMFSCRFDFTTLDNVHFQQAAQIAKALVENQIDFEAMVSTVMKHFY